MELPLKVELPRLSHIHVLQLLLPFVPGIVVTVGLALSSSSLAQRFEVIGVGYKTKLAVAVALTYISGLAVLTVTQTVNSIVMRRIGHERPAEPWNNSYWRRVATTYVGSALSPMSASFSPEDLDRLVKQYAALSTAQNTPGKELTSYREKVLQLDKILSHLRDSVTKVNPVNAEQVRELLAKVQGLISEAEPALHTAKESLDAVENKLRVIGVESEWHWLYEALQFLPTTVQHPFGAFTLLMSSLQAVGLCTLWLMIQYRELWNLVGISFAIVLFLATSHGWTIN